MARQTEDERDASKTARHHRSAEKRTDVPVEITKKQGESATKDTSRKDDGKDKRTDRDEKREHRHRDESGKETRRGENADKTAREELRASSRSSDRKDQLEDKREDRSGHKTEREHKKEGLKGKTDDRSPLEPRKTNAVEGKKKKASKELMCEVCEHREATMWCGDCGDIFYCRKCADADHSRGKRKEHLPLRPADKAPQRAATKVVKCEEHGEILRAYCETDRKAVCSLCLHIGNHKGHSAIELDKAVRAARDSIRKEAGDLILERQKVDTFLDELEEIAESLKKNGADLRSYLRTACDSFRAVLTEREAALLVQVDERESEKTSIIGRQRVRWKDTVAEVNKARDLAEAALKEADPVVLLKKRDTFEQQAHALRIAAARRSATPATTASLDLALEADPIVNLIRESLVFSSAASANRASSVIARLQQAQSQKASLTDNTVVVLPRGCLEVAHVTPNLATNPDSSSPDAWIGRLWELREHLAASEASKAAALELSRTKHKGRRDQPEKENEAAIKAAMKIQARWRGASLRKANSLEVLKAFRGCGVRGSVVYTLEGDSSNGADERYVKTVANLGCLVVLAGRLAETPGKRAPSLSTRNASGPSPLEAWIEAQNQSEGSNIHESEAEAKTAAQISHLVKALPASIRQSGVFLMGHGRGGELFSRAEMQSSLRELVTGTILSGCGQPATGCSGNVLTLEYKAGESSPASFDALLAGSVESGLTATLPADFLEDVATSKDGIFRELLLTFLCKPQRIHLLDKLWETEPHLAKQLTVAGRKGNVLSVSIQPTGRTTRQKRNGASPTAPKSVTPAKEEPKAVTSNSKTLERSGSIRKAQPVSEAPPAQIGSGEPQKRTEPEAAETSGAPRNEGPSAEVGPTSAPGASVGPGANPAQGVNANPNLNPSQAPASSSSNNTGSVPPPSAPPSAAALYPRASNQPGNTLLSTQPGSPEIAQPGAGLASRPSFSSSRPPNYTPGASYTPANPASPAIPPNPAVLPNPTGGYAPSTAAGSPLTSSYGRSASDAAAARAPATQQPPSTGAYVPGASAGRFGQPGMGPSAALPTDPGAPRNGLTR